MCSFGRRWRLNTSMTYFCVCLLCLLLCVFLFPSRPSFLHLTSSTLPFRNLDPGSHSRRFSPFPTIMRTFILISRRVQHFFISSTRVEFCIHTTDRRFYVSALHKNVPLGSSNSRYRPHCSCLLRLLFVFYVYSVYRIDFVYYSIVPWLSSTPHVWPTVWSTSLWCMYTVSTASTTRSYSSCLVCLLFILRLLCLMYRLRLQLCQPLVKANTEIEHE